VVTFVVPVILPFPLGACKLKHVFSLQGERATHNDTAENIWRLRRKFSRVGAPVGFVHPSLTTLKVNVVVIVISSGTLQYLAD